MTIYVKEIENYRRYGFVTCVAVLFFLVSVFTTWVAVRNSLHVVAQEPTCDIVRELDNGTSECVTIRL